MLGAFRVWDKANRRYLTNVEYVYLSDYGNLYSMEESSYSDYLKQLPTNSYVVEFYTGMKDLRGMEICEGDLVQCENYHGLVSGDIKFGKGAFYLSCISGQSDEYLFNCSNIEIIGNVHDAKPLEGNE